MIKELPRLVKMFVQDVREVWNDLRLRLIRIKQLSAPVRHNWTVISRSRRTKGRTTDKLKIIGLLILVCIVLLRWRFGALVGLLLTLGNTLTSFLYPYPNQLAMLAGLLIAHDAQLVYLKMIGVCIGVAEVYVTIVLLMENCTDLILQLEATLSRLIVKHISINDEDVRLWREQQSFFPSLRECKNIFITSLQNYCVSKATQGTDRSSTGAAGDSNTTTEPQPLLQFPLTMDHLPPSRRKRASKVPHSKRKKSRGRLRIK